MSKTSGISNGVRYALTFHGKRNPPANFMVDVYGCVYLSVEC